MKVGEANPGDLDVIVGFIAEEAGEAEGSTRDRQTLERGIGAALEDDSIAKYWLLLDDLDNACGCTSVVKEWSDWGEHSRSARVRKGRVQSLAVSHDVEGCVR